MPHDFGDLVLSLMAKAPEDRPASANDVVKAIDAMGVVPGVGPGMSTSVKR